MVHSPQRKDQNSPVESHLPHHSAPSAQMRGDAQSAFYRGDQDLHACNVQQPSLQSPATDDFSALNALIQDLGTSWSSKARAIKFDIEFKSIEQERRRVANDLHDEILPCLSRLIRSVQSSVSDRCGPKQKEACQLNDELHATIATFRDFLAELHPVDLEELGLAAALSNLCKRYARLTGRRVHFEERSEDCHLSVLQQRCTYRAMQTVLRMFVESAMGTLLVSYNCVDHRSVIALRCADPTPSHPNWLSAGNSNFNTFATWCSMAGAEFALTDPHAGKSPWDLVISICEAQPPREDVLSLVGELTQVRLKELDRIVELAQEEWIELISRDCSLFKNLAVEMERKRISEDISKVILPHLVKLRRLALESPDDAVKRDVIERMQVIESGVAAVISELHPRLLANAGLLSSIKALVDRFRHGSLIDTTIISNLWSKDVDNVPLESKFAIYRVIQEALNNIEKHSGATRALITVIFAAGELLVRIEDNGKGFKGSKASLSRGLKNIRERAAEVGATVSWDQSNSFNSGTLVTISLRC